MVASPSDEVRGLSDIFTSLVVVEFKDCVMNSLVILEDASIDVDSSKKSVV